MDILEKLGIKQETMSKDEEATYDRMVEALAKNKVTPETIKEFTLSMRSVVENELADMSMKRPSFWAFLFNFRRDYQLKARLKVYLQYESFLNAPDKARKVMEESLSNLKVDNK